MLAEDVRAVVPRSDVKSAERSLPWIIGSVLVSGWESPVVDLREKLGVPLGSSGRKPVVIVLQMHSKEGPRWLGIAAEYAGDLLSLRNDDFRNGAVRISGRMKRLLDFDEILSAEDLRSLLSFASVKND